MTRGASVWKLVLVAVGLGVAAGAAGSIRACGTGEREGGAAVPRIVRAGALVARGDGARIYDSPALAPAWPDDLPAEGRWFRHPPCAAVLAAPLGALGEAGARSGWSLLCSLGVGLAVGFLWATGAGPPWNGGARWFPLVLGAAFLPVLLRDWREAPEACVLLGAFALACLALSARGNRAAGFLLGLAAAVKVVPLLLLPWLAWRRDFRAALWGLGTAVAVFFLLPMAAFGPSSGWERIRHWSRLESPWVTEVDEAPGTTMGPAALVAEGQSLRHAFARTLGTWPYLRLRDYRLPASLPEAAAAPPGPAEKRTALVGSAGRRVVWGVLVLGMGAVLVFGCAPRPGEDRGAANRRIALEAGLVLAALFLLSDESTRLHLLLLLPAAAALGPALADPEWRGRPGWWAVLGGFSAAGLLVLGGSDLLGKGFADALLAGGGGTAAAILLFAAGAATLFRERAAAPPAEGATSP